MKRKHDEIDGVMDDYQNKDERGGGAKVTNRKQSIAGEHRPPPKKPRKTQRAGMQLAALRKG